MPKRFTRASVKAPRPYRRKNSTGSSAGRRWPVKPLSGLKGGDPLVFGRGADEIEYLRGYHIQVEVIPGISSAVGIPSRLGIPLTARGVAATVAFISGYKHEEDEQNPTPWIFQQADTLVFLMGLTKLDKIVESLDAKHWPKQTPVMAISKGTCPREKDCQRHAGRHPTEDQRKSAGAAGFDRRGGNAQILPRRPCGTTVQTYPLHRHRPEAVPRARRGDPFPDDRNHAGAAGRRPNKNVAEKSQYLRYNPFHQQIRGEVLFRAVGQGRIRGKKFNSKTFVAIGRATAKALAQEGVPVSLTARVETSEGLFQEMTEKLELRGRKILFPRSALPNPYLKQKLTGQGAGWMN